jgi:hypothetical protein
MAETLVKLVPATVTGPRTAFMVIFRGGCGGVDRVGGAAGGWRSDILLGPEETSVACSSGQARAGHQTACCCGGCVVAGWSGCWSLFENCTVDASIFVVKLPRADGECLGTRSR